jgi:hypothetical protein
MTHSRYDQKLVVSKLSHELDPSMMTSCCGKTAVAREQRRVERFSKGDVDGVIGRKIVP